MLFLALAKEAAQKPRHSPCPAACPSSEQVFRKACSGFCRRVRNGSFSIFFLVHSLPSGFFKKEKANENALSFVLRSKSWAHIFFPYSGYGEIGRRARLRIWCRKAWGFESLYPHFDFRDKVLSPAPGLSSNKKTNLCPKLSDTTLTI